MSVTRSRTRLVSLDYPPGSVSLSFLGVTRLRRPCRLRKRPCRLDAWPGPRRLQPRRLHASRRSASRSSRTSRTSRTRRRSASNPTEPNKPSTVRTLFRCSLLLLVRLCLFAGSVSLRSLVPRSGLLSLFYCLFSISLYLILARPLSPSCSTSARSIVIISTFRRHPRHLTCCGSLRRPRRVVFLGVFIFQHLPVARPVSLLVSGLSRRPVACASSSLIRVPAGFVLLPEVLGPACRLSPWPSGSSSSTRGRPRLSCIVSLARKAATTAT